MARCNRVLPDGKIVAHPARGLFMGNRGILHDDRGQLTRARWKHKAWICCLLSFKGRQREIMAPNRYTELFFLDEAVALSAGHRPCAECRRADYNRFRDAWEVAFAQRPKAIEMDQVLHAARTGRSGGPSASGRATAGTQASRPPRPDDLPHGSFIRFRGRNLLLTDHGAFCYAPDGYTATDRPNAPVIPLTPAPLIDVLRAGYRPALHPSAG